MDLNFILFPAPTRKDDASKLDGHLLWIPVSTLIDEKSILKKEGTTLLTDQKTKVSNLENLNEAIIFRDCQSKLQNEVSFYSVQSSQGIISMIDPKSSSQNCCQHPRKEAFSRIGPQMSTTLPQIYRKDFTSEEMLDGQSADDHQSSSFILEQFVSAKSSMYNHEAFNLSGPASRNSLRINRNEVSLEANFVSQQSFSSQNCFSEGISAIRPNIPAYNLSSFIHPIRSDLTFGFDCSSRHVVIPKSETPLGQLRKKSMIEKNNQRSEKDIKKKLSHFIVDDSFRGSEETLSQKLQSRNQNFNEGPNYPSAKREINLLSAIKAGQHSSKEEKKSQHSIPCIYLKRTPSSQLQSNQKKPMLLIYFHGNGEDLFDIITISKLFNNGLKVRLVDKCDVLCPEYPGYSLYLNMEASEETILNDALQVVHFAKNELGFQLDQMLIVGRSIGSGPAVHLASLLPIGLLVLISPFTSIKSVAKVVAGVFGEALVRQRFDNLAKIGQGKSPILLIHGDQDTLIPLSQSEALAGTMILLQRRLVQERSSPFRRA